MNKKNFFFVFLLGYSSLVLAQGNDTGRKSVTVHEGTNSSIALSPDGETISLEVQGTIFTLPAKGGKATAITDGLGDDHQPAWSPDGQQVAFFSYRNGTYHIWTIHKDGSDLKQITFGVYDDREPQWAPDGKQIIFSSDRGGNYDIWSVELASGKLKQLTTDLSDEYNPAWSADGRQFAFLSDRKEKGLYIKTDGQKEEQVVSGKSVLSAPSWSLDGKYISYTEFNGSQSKLVSVSLNSKIQTVLSQQGEDVFPFRAAWISSKGLFYTADGKIKKRDLVKKQSKVIPFDITFSFSRPDYKKKDRDFDTDTLRKVLGILNPVPAPDAKSIAFSALGDLWVLKEGGNVPVQITSDKAVEIDQAFSPDGKSIVFVSDRGKNGFNLWLHDFGTGNQKQLTFLEHDALAPAWSPDGKEIAFIWNDSYNGIGSSTIQLLEVATGKISQVHASIFGPSKPAWSPDGKLIAVSALEKYSGRFREGISRILLISLNGDADKYVSPLTSRALAVRGKDGPSWSPNGQFIAYIQDGVLWSVPASSAGELLGPPRRLTNELAEAPAWYSDSKSILYIATDHLKKVNVETGLTENISLELSWRPEKPNSELVIHAGRVFDGRSAAYLKNVDIVLQGNRIREIVPHKTGREGTVVDASTKTIIPGLFELHTHQAAGVGEVHGRNWLSYGITSVRETGADPYDALERKEAWGSGKRPGPREFITGALIDGERIYYGMASSISTGAQLDLELDRTIRLQYDLIKTYVRLPDILQRRVTEFAHAHGIPVTSHEIFPAAAYGVDGVEHIRATSRRGYSTKQSALNRSYEDVIQIIAKSGINITPTIALFGGFYLHSERDADVLKNKQLNALFSKNYVDQIAASNKQRLQTLTDIRPLFASTEKVIRKLVDAGARVTPGTDSPLIPFGISLQVELQSFQHAGLTPFEVLRSATLWSAEAVGAGKDLGSIEAGKLADLVIVDGDPLKDVKDAWNVSSVFKNGIQYTIDELLNHPK